jgi:hypothetical protein
MADNSPKSAAAKDQFLAAMATRGLALSPGKTLVVDGTRFE